MAGRGYKEPVDLARGFYDTVDVGPAEGGFAVRLDGRTPKTPGGHGLVLPTQGLARLVADEWAEQGEYILPSIMHATRLANTAIDRVGQARAEVAAEVAQYAGSDLLCYRAEEPAALVERQERNWGPVLDWARETLDIGLEPVKGIVHRPQPSEALERARAEAEALDHFSLAALAHATALFGSATLGFALQRGRLSGEEAFGLSRLDEAFQEERWGIDAEAAERTEKLAAEALMLERWFAALR